MSTDGEDGDGDGEDDVMGVEETVGFASWLAWVRIVWTRSGVWVGVEVGIEVGVEGEDWGYG